MSTSSSAHLVAQHERNISRGNAITRLGHALCQLAIVVGIVGACITPAQAQLFGGDDQARQAILNLREEVNNLRSESQRGRMQLAGQIEQLQSQLAQMRGQIETLTKQVADSKQAQRDLYMDMAERESGPSRPGAPDAGALLEAGGDEQAAYDNAIDLFRKGDYKSSAQQLSTFMSKYPDGSLAPTAQFYLGSSLYAQKEYKSAITQLQAMVKKWPQNQRAPDALLVIAGSQIELRSYDGAKTTLQRIIREYPNTPAAATARERLELL